MMTVHVPSQTWSVYDVFGEITKDRKGFGKIHNTRRRRYDKMSLAQLKEAHILADNELERQYINQNIQIIQLARCVINPPSRCD